MIRARCFALAVLVGVCGSWQAPSFAQIGPAYGPPDGLFPVDEGVAPPDSPLAPVAQPPWYGSPDEMVAASGRYGPLVVASSWWIRAEYLNWQIKNPGNVLLGAPVAGVLDPSQPFVAFAPGTTTPDAIAVVPTTKTIDLTNISGIRVSAGADLIYGGQFEVSAFMLARKQSGFVLGGLGGQADATPFGLTGTLPFEVATSTLSNGQIADHLFNYNSSYQAIMQSQLWGGEANWLGDSDPGALLQCRPLIGARYINLTERLTQRGVFQSLLGPPPIVSTIDSLAMNNLYGGQIGLRATIAPVSWLEFGITPKLLLLGNTMMGSVYTNHFRTNADGTFSSNDTTTSFSVGFEGQTYVQVHIGPRLSARLGYDVLWLSRVTRPQSNIYYNDNGTANPPGVVEQTRFTDILINGFSVGMQITW